MSYKLTLFIAIAPAIVLLVLIYKQDIVEKEPVKLILKCFGFGALSAVVAIFLEMGVSELVDSWNLTGLAYTLVANLVGVALVEELVKMVAALIPTWRNREFNYVFDGIVYCAAAALGFACLENILYVCGADDVIGTGIARGIMSVPGHMCDGIFMGVFIGHAKLSKYRGKNASKWLYILLALAAPIAEHMIYDSLCDLSSGYLYGFVIVVYIIAYIVVASHKGKNDTPIPMTGA